MDKANFGAKSNIGGQAMSLFVFLLVQEHFFHPSYRPWNVWISVPSSIDDGNISDLDFQEFNINLSFQHVVESRPKFHFRQLFFCTHFFSLATKSNKTIKCKMNQRVDNIRILNTHTDTRDVFPYGRARVYMCIKLYVSFLHITTLTLNSTRCK